ncbi:hypothetical protein Dimus_010413 [Dionaea muscipula]
MTAATTTRTQEYSATIPSPLFFLPLPRDIQKTTIDDGKHSTRHPTFDCSCKDWVFLVDCRSFGDLGGFGFSVQLGFISIDFLFFLLDLLKKFSNILDSSKSSKKKKKIN